MPFLLLLLLLAIPAVAKEATPAIATPTPTASATPSPSPTKTTPGPTPTSLADGIAERSYRVDLVLAGVGIAGIFAYLIQSWLMYGAVKEAKRSADAAIINANALVQAQRPRMRVQPDKNPRFTIDWKNEQREIWWDVELIYQNLGGSTAWIDGEGNDIWFIPASGGDEIDAAALKPLDASMTFDIAEFAPNQKHTAVTGGIRLTEEVYKAILAKEMKIVVNGEITYDDVGGTSYATTFCWIFRFLGSHDYESKAAPGEPRWGIVRGPARFNQTTIIPPSGEPPT